MKISHREKRDWTFLTFIVPVGIFLMMIAGQIAVRIVPNWTVDVGMQSSLDLETAPKQQAGLIQPILPEILTPLDWFDTFLTPNANSGGNPVYPPFIIFKATSTPSPTASPVASPPASGTPTTSVSPSPTIVTTPTAIPTNEPPVDDEDPPVPPAPPALCTDTGANNEGSPLPCTYDPPPDLCTDTSANNEGSPVPCTYDPISSPLVGLSTPIPAGYNYGAPNGNTSGANVGNIQDGYYVIITLPTPIVVIGISDTSYDLVYYERQLDDSSMPSGYGIQMDSVILSISTAINGTYYTVFNWGDSTPDANSNIGDVADTTNTENDNQPIDSTELSGSYPQDTGILVDVDNAPSHPPVGDYSYLAIQAPAAPLNDGNDGADVDSVQVLP